MGNNFNILKLGSTEFNFRPLGTCTTLEGTAAKVVSAENFSLFDGATIIVKFTNKNSAASPTLNVNNTGAKSISKCGLSSLNWNASAVIEFRYNGTSYDALGSDINTDTDTDTHYTTGIRTGASGTNANSALTNPYIKVLDNTTYRSQIQLKGGGSTSVSSDANGVITISSTDTNTTYSAATATASGLVSTGAQTFGGTKTFSAINTNTINDNGGTLNIKNDNNTSTSANDIFIESTNGVIHLKSKSGVNILNSNSEKGTITANLNGNASTATSATSAGKLTTARTIDGVYFDGSSDITHLFICQTPSSTVAKACNPYGSGSCTQTAGTRISVYFTYGNTAANPSLSISTLGALPIMYSGGARVGSSFMVAAGSIIEFIHNGTGWAVVGGLSAVDQNIVVSDSYYPLLFSNTADKAESKFDICGFSETIKINPAEKWLSGLSTISPYTNSSSSSASNNELLMGTVDKYNLNLHGTIVTTGLNSNHGSSTVDYIRVANIYVTGDTPGYSDAPIRFTISSRRENFHQNVYVKFNENNTNDGIYFPTSAKVIYELPWSNHNDTQTSGSTIYKGGMGIFLVRMATGYEYTTNKGLTSSLGFSSTNVSKYQEWTLVVKQADAWDYIDLLEVKIPAWLKDKVKVSANTSFNIGKGNAVATYWTPTDWADLHNNSAFKKIQAVDIYSSSANLDE